MEHPTERQRTEIRVQNLSIKLQANIRRVILLPFYIMGQANVGVIFDRVDRLSDAEVGEALATVADGFSRRHRRLDETLEEHYQIAARLVGRTDGLSPSRRLLIGAYFSMEYSLESAALFNPSIVPHPDQSGLPEGSLRFVMSLRAVGEGHLSSTVFQTGVINSDLTIRLDPSGAFSAHCRSTPDRVYHKGLFVRKLAEMGVHLQHAGAVFDRLDERFTIRKLDRAVAEAQEQTGAALSAENVIGAIQWLARANYQLRLAPEDEIRDLILFPRSESEARGIEDMRLVRFVDDDGSVTYYGTYTGFDGEHILPLMMETKDFRTLNVHTLNGDRVQNKGMALFPRRLDGHYVMCSRIDGQNLYLMASDMPYFWETATLLAEPRHSWELRIIGNCGSPLETPEGWLLLTHGVGPMRRYCLGAMLLDLDDPFRIRGRLKRPLIAPTEEEREGYVPNVVYSCGALIHRGRLVLPYAVSDTATRVATIALDELLERLLEDGP